jgi:Uncharacterized protein conserved in bacteria (DUF2219)
MALTGHYKTWFIELKMWTQTGKSNWVLEILRATSENCIGAVGRAVARNIFFDGNMFQNSRSIVKEIVVADLLGGIELFCNAPRFAG